jgi:ankyrin repeat protein
MVAALATAAAADERLLEAVKAGRTDVVAALVKKRVDVNGRAGDGSTALHWAAHRDDLQMTELLLSARANVNAADDHGITSLLIACTNGSLDIAERLLTAGANPNASSTSGHIPLMEASRTGRGDLVKALTAAGAYVNAADPRWGQTPLMWAVAHRHTAVARLLVERGADVRARSKAGFSPLMFAAQQGDLETTRVLLEVGADLHARTPDGGSALLIASASLEASTTGQFTVVNKSGHEAVALLLLEHGANPNVADRGGITPLHAAVRNGRLELTQALIARGANPNAQLSRPENVMFGDVDERLWDAGATPLLTAAKAANVDLMRILVAYGADPIITTSDGTTPLMAAAGVGRTEGQTMVTEKSALEAVALALELKNDINSARSDGWTALHGAAYNGADTVVRFLAKNGASLDARDKDGRTPLSIAEGAKVKDTIFVVHQSTAGLLRSLGARLGLRETTDGR